LIEISDDLVIFFNVLTIGLNFSVILILKILIFKKD